MTVDEIKKMAYNEIESKDLDIVDTYLYDRAAAISKMFKHGYYDIKTAQRKFARAEQDYKVLKLLSDCFDKSLERDRKLERLKSEYNKTKSTETAVKIAETVTEL